MRSRRPKPLHLLCGRPMVLYVLDALANCSATRAVVVVGHGADRVTTTLRKSPAALRLDFVDQEVQRGTGDAVRVALTAFGDDELDGNGDVVVLPGDAPLLRPDTLADLVTRHRTTGAACTVLTAEMDDPTGYGRVVRAADGSVARIVEHADATEDELAISEVNTSIYCMRLAELAPALRRLEPQNAQGEYYLTDVVEVLAGAGYTVAAQQVADPAETQGVNDRLQLAAAESELRRRTNAALMRAGVTMVDPATTYVDTTVEVDGDVTLFPNTILQGDCVVGAGSVIGPSTRLVDCVVGTDVTISYSNAERCTVEAGCVVGPYVVIPDGTTVPSGSRVAPPPPTMGPTSS